MNKGRGLWANSPLRLLDSEQRRGADWAAVPADGGDCRQPEAQLRSGDTAKRRGGRWGLSLSGGETWTDLLGATQAVVG
jgi:hypothetical protein